MQSPSRSHDAEPITRTADGGTSTDTDDVEGSADVDIDPEDDLEERHRRVLEAFAALDSKGRIWVKSVEIARRIPDKSPKHVGGVLRTLSQRELVQKWNPNASAATWGLTPQGKVVAAEIEVAEGGGDV